MRVSLTGLWLYNGVAASGGDCALSPDPPWASAVRCGSAAAGGASARPQATGRVLSTCEGGEAGLQSVGCMKCTLTPDMFNLRRVYQDITPSPVG